MFKNWLENILNVLENSEMGTESFGDPKNHSFWTLFVDPNPLPLGAK